MATGNLIKKKEEFELWLKSQIAKGCDLLKREVSEAVSYTHLTLPTNREV